MKDYSLSIFIFCVFLFTQTTNAQLVARPVVFINISELWGESNRLLERADLAELLSKGRMAQELSQCNTKQNEINKFEQEWKIFVKKIRAFIAIVAKEKGACAVLETTIASDSGPVCIDPAYDITNEVIDRLNKLYVRPKNDKSLKNYSPQEMLYNALLNNSEDEIRMAVKAGAHVNSSIHGKTPLFIAVALAHLNAVKYLLECGAQRSPDLIQLAIEKNDKCVIKLLIEHGAVV